MRKTTKGMAIALAALLCASGLSIGTWTTSAQDSFVLGDVDMDGVITGHDSAMVSRYLNEDAELLDETALTLADINEDGVVDQTDADLIHAEEVYTLGDINLSDSVTPVDAYYSLFIYSDTQISRLTLDDETTLLVDRELDVLTDAENDVTLSPVQYNLADVNADGTVDVLDAYYILIAYANDQVGYDFYANGRYDLYGYTEAVSLTDGYEQLENSTAQYIANCNA